MEEEKKPIFVAGTLVVEAVTRLRAASDPYTSAEPRVNGGGARLVPISLPRVRWLERPEVENEND